MALASGAHAATSKKVLAIHFAPDLEVNPVTQGWVNHQLERAKDDGYAAAVIVLDTPGGLSTSMRKIYQKELASPIPVLVYVAPDGARAGSAGLWISEAGDVLAMAPQTNIGASTPISGNGQNLDKDLRRKVINDAAASIVALAKSHGRNSSFPERAVREAASISAPDALQQHVIDLIAPSLPALLQKTDGYKTKPKGFVLHLGGAHIDNVSPGFFTRLLNTLIDPNILSLLFLAGIAGLGFEIFHPGVVLPGALGAVSLLTALYGFSVLPVSWAGILLLLLGVALLVADVHVTSHGALTVAGLVCLAVGSIMLFQNAPAPYHTSKPLVIGVAVGLGALWAFGISKALAGAAQTRCGRAPAPSPGSVGEVRERRARLRERGSCGRPALPEVKRSCPATHVRVESLDGLVLTVRPVGA